MTQIGGKLYKNPNIENPELNLDYNSKLEKEKKDIYHETQINISVEEFYSMSWESLKDNIKVSDGSLVLFGRPISYWLENRMWNEDQTKGYREFKNSYLEKQNKIKENLKNKVDSFQLLSDILVIWEQKANEIASGVWFQSMRNDGDIIREKIEEINIRLSGLQSLIYKGALNPQNNLDDFNKEINSIFSLMLEAEDQEDIIGEDDIDDIKDVFFKDGKSLKQKEVEIFNFMRYGGWSGNSKGVEIVIENKLLEDIRFKREKDILNNPKLLEFLEDKNLSKLKEILSPDEAKNVLNIYNGALQKIEEIPKENLEFNLKEINKKNGATILTLEEYKLQIKQNVLKSSIEAFKKILIYTNVSKGGYRGDEDTLMGTYANINGLAEYDIWDGIVIGDDKIDLAVDFASSLAIGMVTMGAGIGATFLLRGATLSARGVSIGNKVSKLLRVEKYLVSGSRTSKVTGFIGNATLDGLAFHEGTTIMSNLMFRDLNQVLHGTGDFNEIVKSIAFMGALNSLQIISKIPGVGKIMDYKMKMPKEALKPSVIKKALIGTGNFALKSIIEGNTMFWISNIIEGLIGDGWNPTVEEWLHFVALIQLMHLKDVKLKK